MKVLYISSGNSVKGISPIILNQGESLRKACVDVKYFSIKGKGAVAYIQHIFLLRKYIRKGHFDIYHAHYSLSAITATLAGCNPLVVSLMGSDSKTSFILKTLIRLLSTLWWKSVIVKSESMRKDIRINKSVVIPNGVDLFKVKPVGVHSSSSKKKILFAANPQRYEKNFTLAKSAFSLVNDPKLELCVVHSISHDEILSEINTSDIVLLTSRWEGSPNIIKEAMACNCPIVATDVGDVKWILGNTKGCFITSLDPEDVAKKIKAALNFGKRTNGRKRIIELELDSEIIAGRIIQIYKELLN